jgi:hypothetical protein
MFVKRTLKEIKVLLLERLLYKDTRKLVLQDRVDFQKYWLSLTTNLAGKEAAPRSRTSN